MKVILREDVSNLGNIGEIVNVANGYARNYLIPRNMAVEANPRNVRQFEHIKRVVAAKAEKVKKEKRSMAEQLTSLRLTFKSKAGEDGKLFGSITSMDIQKELGIQGIELDRKKIHLDSPIKRLGEHTVHVKLHSDITADIQVEVVQE
jgi:large subunit ribosomal protein L9